MTLICALSKKICAYLERFLVSQMVDTRCMADKIRGFGLTFAEHCVVKTQYFDPFPNDVSLLRTSRVVHFAQTSISNEL